MQEKKYVLMDLKKIFLTPPNTGKEKIMLLILMVLTFITFFGPLCFSEMHPARALFIATLPALSFSWGWIVLMRSIFRKHEFSR